MNSFGFSRALAKVLRDYENDTGVSISRLTGDDDVKFKKRFLTTLQKRGITLSKARNEHHNAHIERRGRTVKTMLSGMVRRRAPSGLWPLCLPTLQTKLNHMTRVPGTKLSPINAYVGSNFGHVVRTRLTRDAGMFDALYSVPVEAAKHQLKKLYKYKVGETVVVDLTGVKRQLRAPLYKQSEWRDKVWAYARVKRRKLVTSSGSVYVPRYLVETKAWRPNSFWVHPSRIRFRMVQTDEDGPKWHDKSISDHDLDTEEEAEDQEVWPEEESW